MLRVLHTYRAETNYKQEVRKMKKLNILLIGCVFPLSLWATETPVIEEQATKALVESEPRVVILNNQNQQTDQKSAHDQKAQVSNQPTVRVMGTPISVSYAAELKKSREEAELQTEQKIVEKLESSRLRDEQERLNKLFGVGQAKPIAVTHSATTVVKRQDQGAISAQVHLPADTGLYNEKVYAGVNAGQSSNFTNLDNVTSYGSFGATMGVISQAGLILESSFLYSQHQLDTSNKYNNNYDEDNFMNLYQLTGLLSLKYTPSSSRFRPYVGAFIAYNYWMYEANRAYDYSLYCSYSSTKCGKGYTTTDSVDFGPVVGMDFQLSRKVSIGFNMIINAINLYNNRADTVDTEYTVYDSYHYTYNKSFKMEETNWLIASLNAKLYF